MLFPGIFGNRLTSNVDIFPVGCLHVVSLSRSYVRLSHSAALVNEAQQAEASCHSELKRLRMRLQVF